MRAWAAAFALCLAACATPQTDGLRGRPGDLPPTAKVAEVPFYTQRTKECGPAALAMAMTASGLTIGPDALVDEVMTPGREGSLTPGLITAARRHGRLAYPVAGMRDLFRQVGAGYPVVVLQNLALSWAPQWHYAVVTGYDLDLGILTLHSGETPDHVMSMRTFELTWARGGHWGLVVLEPGAQPADPDPARYLPAAAGLERADRPEAARAAYEAALKAWPGNLAARMGLGNVLYAQGRLDAAAEAFSQATRDHPEAADAFNNLAQVRLEQGRLKEAEAAARRAVELGGANLDIYRQTLTAITAKQAGPSASR